MDTKSPAVYGVLGFPVKHSLSPLMQNAAFKALGINATYKLFEVAAGDLEEFFYSLEKNNIRGLNITIPYKERALQFVKLPAESNHLFKVKAINTAVFAGGVWYGFNTDITGFARHLKENIDPVAKRAAIIGAGGAARAVSYVLANEKVRDIAICDVDASKARLIAGMVSDIFPGFPIYPVSDVEALDIAQKDILINATPCGMKPADPCLVPESKFHKNLFVYDLIYTPVETKLLARAKARGCKTANGLKMLLYQGAGSFEHWTGEKPPEDIMWKALKEGVGQA
ncbi:MAG TPA: shikimate dehydrogenase [Candidatus Omnitrophota bacterium]|nr:shikimate dehydrogenase [Candidatus Omnitrophota bacterium]HPT07243.1 shikimate dehydrogenase [Candidatus Omnitrophota bacterium]